MLTIMELVRARTVRSTIELTWDAMQDLNAWLIGVPGGRIVQEEIERGGSEQPIDLTQRDRQEVMLSAIYAFAHERKGLPDDVLELRSALIDELASGLPEQS
jgi:hypothetical protein